MSSAQPCFEFLKKGLDKALFMCCNCKQFRFLEEGSFKETSRMKAISAHRYLNPAFTSDNNFANKNRKKEESYA
jgi:hypothetical protein